MATSPAVWRNKAPDVTACDFSEVFLEHARARTSEHADRIDYRLLDATNPTDLASLEEHVFDAVYCGMALHDMATIDPLLTALQVLLTPTGPPAAPRRIPASIWPVSH